MGSDKVIVLCEDRAQEKPIRAWLQELGYNSTREVRFEPYSGTNRGHNRDKHWVDEMFVSVVRQQRSRSTRMQCSLVVCRDADDDLLVEVERAFEVRLAADNQSARASEERIALLIPKRHIETWMSFLAGEVVNEDDDYKNVVKLLDVNASARQFALTATGKIQRLNQEPPSLAQAFNNECPRIPKR